MKCWKLIIKDIDGTVIGVKEWSLCFQSLSICQKRMPTENTSLFRCYAGHWMGLCPATMIQGLRARACRCCQLNKHEKLVRYWTKPISHATACINMTFGLVKFSSIVGQIIWKPPWYWQIPAPSPTTEVVSLLLLGDSTLVGCKHQDMYHAAVPSQLLGLKGLIFQDMRLPYNG